MWTQDNYRGAARMAVAVAATLLALAPVSAGSISRNSGPDPILTGPTPGPCAQAAAGPDYVAGVDATGNPVAPADETVAPLPDKEVLVTVPSRRGREVSVPV